MEAVNWTDCPFVSSDPQVVHGEPVFRGTRLPASTIVENVDAYLDEGLSLDEAVAATLESFPTVPNGTEGIRAILAYRATQEQQPTP